LRLGRWFVHENPQILIDAVDTGVRGMLVIFDNRRMAAISSLPDRAISASSSGPTTALPSHYAKMASAVAGVKAIHADGPVAELQDALERVMRTAD